MEFKLCRIFNILRPQKIIIAIISTLIIIKEVISIEGTVMLSAILLVGFWTAMLCWCCWDYSKTLTVINKTVFYTERIRVSSVSVFIKRIRRMTKVDFKVTNIRNVEYRQNPIEKLFNTGHIIFQGETEFTVKPQYGDWKLNHNNHIIYGITKFERFRDEFSSCI